MARQHRSSDWRHSTATTTAKPLQSGRGMLPSIKIGTCSREKKERGRAEVGYPANQEIETPGLVDVFRFEGNIADEIARMIQGHEHHARPRTKSMEAIKPSTAAQ